MTNDERAIERDGLIEAYVEALIQIVTQDKATIYYSAIEAEGSNGHVVAWQLVTATADQRAEAARRVRMRGSGMV